MNHQRRATKPTAPRVVAKTRAHPLFGDIPLIPRTFVDANERVHEVLEYDTTYEPTLPRGAVRGDISRQDFCCHVPRYFYVDVERSCVQCGDAFVFAAAEQKHWYETLRFNLRSEPTRCLVCRRQRRSDKALSTVLAEATSRARDTPDDPSALISVAEAIVAYRKRYGQGDLDAAIAACRRARRLLKQHPTRERSETNYWEGLAHALDGRRDAAREQLETFLAIGATGRHQVALAKEARAWLAVNANAVD